ncbi:MAG TPA: DUF3592 domain-containing protein [Kofleriaceae bacterium]|nr:DUF3592 domain-containing protein [Kofleriaceae bacterium]
MTGARPGRALYLAGAALVVIPLLLIAWLVGWPVGRTVRALRYSETECVIDSAQLKIWRDSDGDRHESIDVAYHYQVGDRIHRSRRYDLWGNHKGDARAIVASLRPGTRVRCFYDPDRPDSAVVDRSIDPTRMLVLLALSPLVAGVQLFRWTWRRRRWQGRERRRHVELIGARPRRLALERLGATLASRLMLYGLLGPALLTLCMHDRWGVLGQVARGELAFWPGLWVIILLVVAVSATALFVHTVMRALGPRFALATVQPARRGVPVTLQWRAGGVTPSIRSLSLQLVGREEADYERPAGDSTETGTDTREFHRQDLVRLARGDRSQLSHGSVSFEPPAFAFSFDGGWNRVRWTVVLVADVAGWADVRDELEIDIAP